MTLATHEDAPEILLRPKKGVAHMFSRGGVNDEKLKGSELLHDLVKRPGAGLTRDIPIGIHDKDQGLFGGIYENGGPSGGIPGFLKIFREEKLLFLKMFARILKP